uniref:Non-structural protein NS1 n=1 Tax=Japanaut virus TaxID=2547358 RepID=A0A482A284_9REOV|nr:NS1 [Japanaut virus]
METFLSWMRDLSADQRYALRLFAAIANQWTCSHRTRDCLFGNGCLREQFHRVIEDLNGTENVAEGRRVVECVVNTLRDRETVWLNVYRSFGDAYHEDFPRSIEDCSRQLRVLFNQTALSDRMEDLRAERRSDRIYLDDARSLFHCTYVPLNKSGVIMVKRSTRYGKIGVCCFGAESVSQYLPGNAFDLRGALGKLKANIATKVPVCQTTGCTQGIRHVVFVRERMFAYFSEPGKAKVLGRYLENAVRMLDMIGGADERRICMQMFGEVPSGEMPIHTIMMEKRHMDDGRMSLVEWMQNNERIMNVDMCYLPLFTIRQIIYHRLHWDTLDQYMNYVEHVRPCQLCFLEREFDIVNYVIIDTRLSELTNSGPIRTAREHAHDVTARDLIRMPLRATETLVRVENHWLKTQIFESEEAILTVATQTHRNIRGEGLYDDDTWIKGLYQIMRLLVGWRLNIPQRGTVFKLVCYAFFGHLPRRDGTVANWDDLGMFILLMTGGSDYLLNEDETVTPLMLQLLRSVLAQYVYEPIDTRHQIVQLDSQAKNCATLFSRMFQ